MWAARDICLRTLEIDGLGLQFRDGLGFSLGWCLYHMLSIYSPGRLKLLLWLVGFMDKNTVNMVEGYS